MLVAWQDEGGPKNHVVKFYKNNIFTVDDGPPRSIEDPANMEFINSVSKGECPRELDPGPTDTPVTVNLLRVEEEYEMPK
jgi:UBX domain-containing protein 1